VQAGFAVSTVLGSKLRTSAGFFSYGRQAHTCASSRSFASLERKVHFTIVILQDYYLLVRSWYCY
jgi:hypothetical protein